MAQSEQEAPIAVRELTVVERIKEDERIGQMVRERVG
jgi:hypothetical protein